MAKDRFHPSEPDLLLYVDGELPGGRAAELRRHLAWCWDCRTRVAHMETAITEFVSLRRGLLDRRIPPARAARGMLTARIRDAAPPARATSWFPARLLWIAAASVACLLLILLVKPAPTVSAKEILARVEAAERISPRGAVLHQRVRIRRGDKAAAAVDYDFWRGPDRSRLIPASLHAGPAAELQAFYRGRGVNWDSPLSGTAFSRLRQSLGEVRDEVSGDDLITIRSEPVSGEVKGIEITLRGSDWHPISQRVELSTAKYEITELLRETVSLASVDPSIFGEPTAAAPALTAVRIPPVVPVPALLPPSPTDKELEEAEVRLRERLHETGADIREIAGIERRGERIHLELWVDSPARKAEMLGALEDIPFLTAQVYDTEPDSIASLPLAAPQTLYSTQPPLRDALSESLGGLEAANNYLDEARDSWLRLLVDASALERLAARYPEALHLPPGLRTRIQDLTADHLRRIAPNLQTYLRVLALSLDEHAPAVGGRDTAPSCMHLAVPLRQMQTAFLRLFVEERVEVPVALSTPELVRAAAEARSGLERWRERCRN